MDPIVDVTGDEAKMAMIQFLGQNMSELRQLDSYIINKTNTLQGFALNARDIIDKIPGGPSPGILSESVPAAETQLPTIQVVTMQTPVVPVVPVVPKDQLEFDFRYDVAKDIAEQLNRLNARFDKFEATLNAIERYVADGKSVNPQKKT